MKRNYVGSVLVIFLILAVFIGNISAETPNWGGISSPVNKTPAGTTLDTNLTAYYKVPTATGNGNIYWYIGGWGWFNESEMLKLPTGSIQNDISPYDCETYGCGSGGSSIRVPISGYVIIGFIVLATIFVWKERKRRNK